MSSVKYCHGTNENNPKKPPTQTLVEVRAAVAQKKHSLTHLLVQLLPVALEHMLARDDNVNLPGTLRHSPFNLCQAHPAKEENK
jgi:hypothetical protein